MAFLLIIQDGENPIFISGIQRSMHTKTFKKFFGWNRHEIYLSIGELEYRLNNNIQP